MRRFFKRPYRERRRLAIIAIVTFMGGFIAFFQKGGPILGLPAPVMAGLAFMFGLTPFLTILVVLFPKIRHSAESVAISIPVLSLMGAFGDGGMSSFTSVSGILLCYLIVNVYGGAWVDRYLPRRSRQIRSSATTNLQPAQVWPYLTVTPDTFAEYGSEETLLMEWVEPGVSYRILTRSGDFAKIEEIHTIEVNDPYKRFRLGFLVPDASDAASCAQGVDEFRIEMTKHGTKIATVREFYRMSFRAHLFLWIDDAMGRCDDKELQRAEKLFHE